jgi:predicted SnoaL-like aldol condensation-catalyzing enzyme
MYIQNRGFVYTKSRIVYTKERENMGKIKIVNMRLDGDLVEEVKQVSGFGNLTAITILAYQEYIMTHKPRAELIKEEIATLKARIAVCEDELKDIEELKPEKEVVQDSVSEKNVDDRLVEYWDRILPTIQKDGIDHTLENPDFLIYWNKKLKTINQKELKDVIRRKYNREK